MRGEYGLILQARQKKGQTRGGVATGAEKVSHLGTAVHGAEMGEIRRSSDQQQFISAHTPHNASHRTNTMSTYCLMKR
jgi:hypothetical protein